MLNTSLVLFGIFIILLICNIPIAVSLGIASIVSIVVTGLPIEMFPINVFSASSKFSLLAIPFFIVAGNIMEKAGISEKLIDFAKACVGHRKNGVALVCVIVSCFFCGDLRLGPCNGSGARRNPDSLHGKGRVSGDLCLRAYGGRRRDWRYHSAVSNVYRIWSKFRGVHCQDLYGRRNSGTTDGGGPGICHHLLRKEV